MLAAADAIEKLARRSEADDSDMEQANKAVASLEENVRSWQRKCYALSAKVDQLALEAKDDKSTIAHLESQLADRDKRVAELEAWCEQNGGLP